MTHSNALRRYRKARGLKQHEVARHIGLQDGSLISRWENGCSLPDLKNAFKLALVYGVPVDVLFSNLRHQYEETKTKAPKGSEQKDKKSECHGRNGRSTFRRVVL